MDHSVCMSLVTLQRRLLTLDENIRIGRSPCEDHADLLRFEGDSAVYELG